MKRMIALLTLFLALSPTIAVAAPSEADIKKAVQLSSTAIAAYDKGDFATALTLYTKAHSLWAAPRISFAIAKCLEALGRYGEALRVVKRGLTENPTPTVRARLESRLQFLAKKLSKGQLSLRITPSGAAVSIDGKAVGTAPLETQTLPSGNHNLEITHPNYAKIVQGITIKGGSELQLSFTLQPLTGVLSVTSTPSGAEVEVDGKSMGKTPLEGLKIPVGSHLIKIQYAGYQATTRRINVSAQQSENIAVVLSQLSLGTEKGAWYQSWPGWTLLALGVVAGGVGAIFIAQSRQTHTQVQNAAQNPASTNLSQEELNNQWNQANVQEKVSYGLFGAAGGLIIISVVLFATRTGTGTTQKPAQPISRRITPQRGPVAAQLILHTTH